jgi:N-acetyl-anhydromuramyl-L-alanine amidase AmpD
MKKQLVIVVTLLLILLLIRRVFGTTITNITRLLPKHATKTFPSRNKSQIEQIVVHHTAGPENQTPKQVATYHVGPNHVCDSGCPGILYHYFITRSGKIYQVNELETIAWHLAGQNTRSVGVVMAGNYDNYPATRAQLKALHKTIKAIERKVGRSLELTTHRGECPGCTQCPGDYLQAQIASV